MQTQYEFPPDAYKYYWYALTPELETPYWEYAGGVTAEQNEEHFSNPRDGNNP